MDKIEKFRIVAENIKQQIQDNRLSYMQQISNFLLKEERSIDIDIEVLGDFETYNLKKLFLGTDNVLKMEYSIDEFEKYIEDFENFITTDELYNILIHILSIEK